MSIYLGYFLDPEPKELYEIFVVGEDKKEAYERYQKFFEDEVVGSTGPDTIIKLPIEKFHYNDDISCADRSLLELLIVSDYPKVWFSFDTSNDDEKYNEIMSDDYIDNHKEVED